MFSSPAGSAPSPRARRPRRIHRRRTMTNGARTRSAWPRALRLMMKTAPGPVMIRLARVSAFFPFCEIVVAGRSTGLERRTVLTLFELDGHWYVGHPNGHSQWVRNLLAADTALLRRRDRETRIRAIELV